MQWALRQVAVIDEASEPVSLDQAKAQVNRVASFADDDTRFQELIAAARAKVEADTGRTLRDTRYELVTSMFPCRLLRPPVAPLLEVESIAYRDTAGATQTLASSAYVVLAPSGPTADYGRIALAYGQTWPTTRWELDAVTVTLRAGYDADEVPSDLVHAMRLLIGHWYLHPEAVMAATTAVVPLGYEALIEPYRLHPMPVLE